MKLKLKLDKKTLLDFLIQNVEKIVFGIITLIFLMMLYSSLTGTSRYEKTPEQLQKDAKAGRDEIERTTFDGYTEAKLSESSSTSAAGTSPTGTTGASATPTTGSLPPAMPGKEIPDYVKQAKHSRDKIEEKPYAMTAPLDKRLFRAKRLRTDPVVLTVQDMRAVAGMGAFQVVQRDADEPGTGTERVRGKRWIVVTGLVPIEKQEAAYLEAFQASPGYDAARDCPQYIGYWVQRLEVTGQEGELDWSKAKEFLSRKEMKAAQEEWASNREMEIVDPKYLNNAMVFPLGPMVNRTWDADVAHEPEIPLMKAGDRTGGGAGRGAIRGGMMDRVPTGGRRMPGGALGPGGLPAGGRATGRRDAADDAANDTPFGDDDRNNDKDLEGAIEEEKYPSHLLFRFFDFHVEPGKRYVYRVRLALKNPNQEMKTSYLVKPELKDKKMLETKWSDATEPISVLRDTRIFVASVKPGRVTTEPSTEVLLTTWLDKKGVEIYKDFTVYRGSVINFTAEGKIVGNAENTGGMAGPMAGPMGGPMGGPEGATARRPAAGAAGGRGRGDGLGGLGAGAPAARPTPTQATESLKGNFVSDATMIDIRGGEKLRGLNARKPSSLTAAGEILVLNANGTLVIHNEFKEKATCDRMNGKSTSTATPAGDRRTPSPRAQTAPAGRRGPGLDNLEGGATRKPAGRTRQPAEGKQPKQNTGKGK
jgi:hypothetical protein